MLINIPNLIKLQQDCLSIYIQCFLFIIFFLLILKETRLSDLYRLTNLTRIDLKEKGIGRAPFDPAHSITSLMTKDESLFVGTSLDFRGE